MAEATALLGPFNRNVNVIREFFPVDVRLKGDRLIVEGEAPDVERVARLLDKLRDLVARKHVPEPGDVRYLAERIQRDRDVAGVLEEVV